MLGVGLLFMGLHSVAEAGACEEPRTIIEMVDGKIVVEFYKRLTFAGKFNASLA